MIPVYINCRDRVSDLRQLVAWLEKAEGISEIVLLDNDSTWPPLLEYLDASPHRVVRLGQNLGCKAIWTAQLIPVNDPFVYTDPDVVPIDECPLDMVPYLWDTLQAHAWDSEQKCGLGLYLDDMPPTVPEYRWEQSLVTPDRMCAPGVFHSKVDTTFAVYRPGSEYDIYGLRTGFPYQGRHTSWYQDGSDDESKHYLKRALLGPNGSSWAGHRVP